MTRSKKAADRIRESIPLVRVLSDYGYEVDPKYEDHEQQFSCDLHGDGQDGKPSARVYPHNNQFFCFACGRSRDAITLVREKEGLDFWAAIKKLERDYGLAPLAWEPGEEEKTPSQIIQEALNPRETFEGAMLRLSRFLSGLTRERSLTAMRCAGLWEAHDKVFSMKEKGGLRDDELLPMVHKILASAKEALKEV